MSSEEPPDRGLARTVIDIAGLDASYRSCSTWLRLHYSGRVA